MQEFFQDAALLNLSDCASPTFTAASRQLPAPSVLPSSNLPPQTAPSHTIGDRTLTQDHSQYNTHSTLLPLPKNCPSTFEGNSGGRNVPWLAGISPSSSQSNTSSKALYSGNQTPSTDCCQQQLNTVLTSPTATSIQQLKSFRFSKPPPCPCPVSVAGLPSNDENPAKRRAVCSLGGTLNSITVTTSGATTQQLSSSLDRHAHSQERTSSTPSIIPHTPRAERSTPRPTCTLSQERYSVLPSTPQSSENTPFHANSTNLSLSAPKDPHRALSVMATPISTPTRPLINEIGTLTPVASGQHVRRKFPGPAGILPKLVS